MTPWDDSSSEMESQPLDPSTAERMLTGTLRPDDAPAGFAKVAHLLSSARVEPASGPLPGERETVTAMVAAVRDSMPSEPLPSEPVNPRRSRVLTRAKIAAAGVAGALTLSTGLAAAGALPGAAQGVASDMLDKVGVSVPDPNASAGDHPHTRGKSAGHKAVNEAAKPEAPEVEVPDVNDPVTGGEPAGEHPANKGEVISQLAHDTPPGPGHGAAVSAVASDGKSHAGENQAPDTGGGEVVPDAGTAGKTDSGPGGGHGGPAGTPGEGNPGKGHAPR